MKKLRRILISLLLTVALVIPMVPVSLFAVSSTDHFKITDIEIISNRHAIVHVNNAFNTHFEMFSQSRPNYLTNFIKVDGVYQNDNLEVAVGTGARIYMRDDRKSFDLVLGSSTGVYSGPGFLNAGGTIQFDFNNKQISPYYHMRDENKHIQSGDEWVRDIYDNPISQDVVRYPAGTYEQTPNLAIDYAEVLDSRSLYVRFNTRVVMPENTAAESAASASSLINRMYAYGGNFNLGSVQCAYSYRLEQDNPRYTVGNGREFILIYQNDISAEALNINWTNAALKGMINTAGTGEAAVTYHLEAGTRTPADINMVRAELTKSESGRNEIEIQFDKPFAYTKIEAASRFRTVNSPSGSSGAVGAWCNKVQDTNPNVYFQSVFETATGMCGTVLTANDLKEIFTFTDVYADGVSFLDAFTGDTVLGYFKNSHTILINNNNRLNITLGASPSVTAKTGTLIGYGTRAANNTTTGQTNGPRNTATGKTITANSEVTPYADGYDPNWDKGVTVTYTTEKFGHNDVYFLQYDGINDPLIGGFGGTSAPKHATTANAASPVIAPDGRAFTGSQELAYVVQSYYPAIELENKYVKATIVPEQAARFLKFIFKPTGNDAFYTNPAATNYNIQSNTTQYPPQNIGGGTFVLGWLFVWGGTFPVFDGCEHGQVFSSGFEYEVKDYDDGSKSVVCRLKNDQNAQVSAGGYVPSSNNTNVGGAFTPFGTGIEYTFEYKLAVDSPVVDMIVTVYNPAQIARTYEYYTCNTYAPGEDSQWGHGTTKYIDSNQIMNTQGWTAFSMNAHTGEASNGKTNVNPYTNAANRPQSIQDRNFNNANANDNNSTRGDIGTQRYYEWETMRYVANYQMKTNFANDLNRLPQADWAGCVNLSNMEGIVRAGKDLNKATPGIKYWTWGYRHQFDNIPFERESNNSARPYLEPWPAASNQYFQNRAIDADETHHWTESYYHTFGLDMGTNATADGIAQLKFYNNGSGAFRPVAEFYATKLEKQLTAVLRNSDTNEVLDTYPYTSKIMAAEILISSAVVASGTKVTLELYEGASASGTPFFTAWALADRTAKEMFLPDYKSPVEKVIISHGKSIDIPGRGASGQYNGLREVFAYSEPYSADGFCLLSWSKPSAISGSTNDVVITSGVAQDITSKPAPENQSAGNPTSTSNWWHTFDYITLRGVTPGASVILRATSLDNNANPKPYAEITVNVKKPLYLKIPFNPGNDTGSISGQTLARTMYSPYNFNLDMNLPLQITKHASDTISGDLKIEIWDRNHEMAEPFFSTIISAAEYAVAGNDIGTFPLFIPAYTLPREEYYRIVVRTLDAHGENGDALGYEFFRVDGHSAIDWTKTVQRNGDDLMVRYDKKNANISGTIRLSPEAIAYVNDVACSVSVSTASNNMNRLIITGGYSIAAEGENTIEIVGVQFPQYPNYSITESLTYIKP